MSVTEAIEIAAEEVKMQVGKDRMVDKAIELTQEICYWFDLEDEEEIENKIWELV